MAFKFPNGRAQGLVDPRLRWFVVVVQKFFRVRGLLAVAVIAALAGCSATPTAHTVPHTATPTAASPSPTPLFPGVAAQGSPEEDFLFKMQAATTMSTTEEESAILQWAQAYCHSGRLGDTRTLAVEAADEGVATIHDAFVRKTVLNAADSALCPGIVDADPPGFAAEHKKALAAEAAAAKKAAAEKAAKAKAKALREKRAEETYIFVKSGSGRALAVTWGIDGSTEQAADVSLPWKHKIGADEADSSIIVIVAQNAGGGSITCGFEDGNGKTWNTHTSTGQYAVVSCN